MPYRQPFDDCPPKVVVRGDGAVILEQGTEMHRTNFFAMTWTQQGSIRTTGSGKNTAYEIRKGDYFIEATDRNRSREVRIWQITGVQAGQLQWCKISHFSRRGWNPELPKEAAEILNRCARMVEDGLDRSSR